ncbi:MAG: methionine synthase [Chlorogloea purpurea SAG 13.99]|jgi:hypothetical protein|nr:methionine synthase [Chlorogloea purpurea SAG 13.99]
METRGIYTLANDTVYDQLVALLNSIEKNIGEDIPVCVIPYNNNLEKTKKEINSRSQVKLFDDQASLQRWDNFINEVWPHHPQASARLTRPNWYKGFVHRKFASFDGEFDRFVFFDADSLAMKPLQKIFKKLDDYDLVYDDWEHNERKFYTELDLDAIKKSTGMTEAQIRPQLHCDSFFASKRGLFPPSELEFLKKSLIDDNHIQWVYDRCWWSSSAIFNTLTLQSKYSMFNFTLSPDGGDRTGNCADADEFVEIDGVLYNKQGLKPLHRIHYMNYASADFTRLCQGEDVNILYKEIFLKYRFLKTPEQEIKQLKKPGLFVKGQRKLDKLISKVKKVFA